MEKEEVEAMTKTTSSGVTTISMDRDELQVHLEQLIRRAGRTPDQLRAAGDRFELDAGERVLLDDIEGVEWLLRRGD